VKGKGLNPSNQSKLDTDHADGVRSKLDEKIVALNEEKKILIYDYDSRCVKSIGLRAA